MTPQTRTFDIPPRQGFFRVRDRFSYIKSSIQSIFRNKRRSISMISGLILGVSILSGIMLYSTVLMNNVYDTVIEGSPYEIRMDFKDSLSENQYQAFRTNFLNDTRISDAQLMYGDARTIVTTTATSTSINTLAELETQIIVEHSNESFDSSGLIFSNELYFSEIGSRLRNRFLTGSDTGIYTTNSPYYHGIIISQNLAEAARLLQGNTIDNLTLSITTQDLTNIFTKNTVFCFS